MKTIGEKLIELRGKRTLKEIADAVGTTTQAVWNYENDIRVPRDEIKVKLAKFYKTTVQKIFFN